MSRKQIDSYLLRLPQHCIICAVNYFLMKSANKISDGGLPAVRSGNFLSFLLWGSTFPSSDSSDASDPFQWVEKWALQGIEEAPLVVGVPTCGALDLGLNPVSSPRG